MKKIFLTLIVVAILLSSCVSISDQAMVEMSNDCSNNMKTYFECQSLYSGGPDGDSGNE